MLAIVAEQLALEGTGERCDTTVLARKPEVVCSVATQTLSSFKLPAFPTRFNWTPPPKPCLSIPSASADEPITAMVSFAAAAATKRSRSTAGLPAAALPAAPAAAHGDELDELLKKSKKKAAENQSFGTESNRHCVLICSMF